MSLLSPELEAFVAIVKTSTVHGAGKEIGLTQTGITQRIRSLERKVGATLFTRSRKGMKLTEEGEALYIYCQKVLDIEGETLSMVHGASTKKNVRIQIAGSSSIMRSRVITTGGLSGYKVHLSFYGRSADDKILKIRGMPACGNVNAGGRERARLKKAGTGNIYNGRPIRMEEQGHKRHT